MSSSLKKLSDLGQHVRELENRMSDVLQRLTDVEGHWDAVYEAMRRKDPSQEAAER